MLTDLAATEQDVKNIYKVGLNTTRLLLASGDVVVGYLLLKGAAVAAEKLADRLREGRPLLHRQDRRREVLRGERPAGRLRRQRALAEAVDLDLMELDEAAF